jgi:hypothetical protein
LSHPFESFPRTGRRRALIALIAAAIAMFIVLTVLDAPLRATDEGGTVSLEVAGTTDRATEIKEAWRADGVLDDGAFIDGLDFLYAPLYTAALAGGCVAAAGTFRRLGRERLARAGIAIAWLASAVTIFDWTENVALATVLLDEPTSPWPAVALVAAIPKFAGSTVALLYALAGGAVALARRPRVTAPQDTRRAS